MNAKTTGFASPAQGYENATIDLNRLLVSNPPATYLYRLESEEMAAFGLSKGAILVVDRSKPPLLNRYVLIRHEGQFLCRLLTEYNGSKVFSNGHTVIMPTAGETEIIGTITASIQEYAHVNAH
jgi:DNA polymerase V